MRLTATANARANATTYSTTARAIAYVVALAVFMAPLALRSAHADSPREQAREHYVKGKDLFSAGDYRGAITEFQAADRLAPSPVLQFNIGLAYEQLGDREQALKHYRAYLALVPDAPNRPAVQAKIDRIEAALRAAGPPAPAPAPTPAPAPAPTPAPATGDRAVGVPPDFGPAESADQPAPAPAPAPARAPAPASASGDPALARVAAIDVASVRDQRAAAMDSAEQTTAGQRGDSHAAFAEGGDKPAPKPAYKKWWFWVVVGVSAFILIDILASDSGEDDVVVGAPMQAPVLFRF